jgi:hypothetical protein
MTDSFLLVVAPWIIFGVCLILLWIRLLCARRSGDRSPELRRRRDDEPEQEPGQEQPMRRDDNPRRRVTRRAGRL